MDFVANIKERYYRKSKFDQILENLEKKRLKYVKELSKAYKRPDNPLILIKEFNGLKKGDRIELSEGVHSHLVEITNGCITFIVISKKGGSIGKHRHDVDEDVKVLEGQLIEKVQDYMIEPGQTVTIKKLVAHNIEATKYSIYSVSMKLY